jgi:hypothetical protein
MIVEAHESLKKKEMVLGTSKVQKGWLKQWKFYARSFLKNNILGYYSYRLFYLILLLIL